MFDQKQTLSNIWLSKNYWTNIIQHERPNGLTMLDRAKLEHWFQLCSIVWPGLYKKCHWSNYWKLKIYSYFLKLLSNAQMWSQSHVVISLRMARNCSQVRAARAARLHFPVQPNQILILWHCYWCFCRQCQSSLGCQRNITWGPFSSSSSTAMIAAAPFSFTEQSFPCQKK